MSLRDLFVEVGMEIDDDPLKELDAMMDNVKEAFEDLDGIDPFKKIEKETKSLSGDFDDLNKDIKKADKAVEDLDDNSLNDLEKETKKAGGAMNWLKSTVVAVGVAIGGYIAVDTIKDFAVGAIEAAASAQALDSQFEQVFKGVESDASGALSSIAKETSIAEGRLKGSFVKIAAFAMTTGLDTKEALSISERATMAAADSAAFYDRSIEDVTENLQSFLKGSYENDAALGISATEFTRNAAAVDLFGKEFKKLSEAQKQETLLKMVEDGNKTSKALGQAAREADGFENIIGNLKQAWVDFQAASGKEFLPHVTTGIKWLTEKIVAFDPTPMIDGAFAIADGFVTGYDAIMNFIDTFDWLIAGILGGVTAYYAITGAMAIYNAAVLFAIGTGPIYTAVTGAMTFATTAFGAAVAFLTSPIGIAVAAIAGIIAIGVLLYKNWDVVVAKTKDVLGAIGGLPSIITIALGPLGFLINAAIDLAKNWDSTKSIWENVWGAIQRSAATSVNAVIGTINGLIKTLNKIPGVSIPLVAKVDWGSFEKGGTAQPTAPKTPGMGPQRMALDTGLGRVPYDDMPALLHKDEAVIQADEADALRSAGILKGDGRYPEIDLSSGGQNGGGGGSVKVLDGGGGNNTSIHAPVVIQVQGGNTNEETAQNLKDALDEYFADLDIILGG
ncbi:hypothetical protein [Lysinibacillus sp. 54212]|uniref:hypothetical protein n=1 Tax=Lysinibacillus sp. 54212 TaxID=3119829 RepID=UPI002FCB4861